ncbi:MAG: hypothetical protein WEK74_10145, partial [Hydrogenophaga sp.]
QPNRCSPRTNQRPADHHRLPAAPGSYGSTYGAATFPSLTYSNGLVSKLIRSRLRAIYPVGH